MGTLKLSHLWELEAQKSECKYCQETRKQQIDNDILLKMWKSS